MNRRKKPRVSKSRIDLPNLFITNVTHSKINDVLFPSFILLMSAFSYGIQSLTDTTIDTTIVNNDTLLPSMRDAAKDDKVAVTKLAHNLKGYQDVLDMNVYYQLRKIGVPSQLLKMGSQLGKLPP